VKTKREYDITSHLLMSCRRRTQHQNPTWRIHSRISLLL
jgi:hypothetical protein